MWMDGESPLSLTSDTHPNTDAAGSGSAIDRQPDHRGRGIVDYHELLLWLLLALASLLLLRITGWLVPIKRYSAQLRLLLHH